MVISDKRRFVELMLMLADVCESEASTSKINTYWEILREYPIENVEHGFKALLQTHKYKTFPMPATIIESIVGDPVVLGLDGWNKLERAIERFGVYQNPELDDPILQHTILRFGGWVKVCLKNRELDDVGFQIFQRDFQKCYQSLALRGDNGTPQKLIGMHDIQNERVQISEVVRKAIGNA